MPTWQIKTESDELVAIDVVKISHDDKNRVLSFAGEVASGAYVVFHLAERIEMSLMEKVISNLMTGGAANIPKDAELGSSYAKHLRDTKQIVLGGRRLTALVGGGVGAVAGQLVPVVGSGIAGFLRSLFSDNLSGKDLVYKSQSGEIFCRGPLVLDEDGSGDLNVFTQAAHQ